MRASILELYKTEEEAQKAGELALKAAKLDKLCEVCVFGVVGTHESRYSFGAVDVDGTNRQFDIWPQHYTYGVSKVKVEINDFTIGVRQTGYGDTITEAYNNCLEQLRQQSTTILELIDELTV